MERKIADINGDTERMAGRKNACQLYVLNVVLLGASVILNRNHQRMYFSKRARTGTLILMGDG